MKRHYTRALNLSLALSLLFAPYGLASQNEITGTIGSSTLGWNVSHGDPQAQKDAELLEKKVPELMAQHKYAELEALAGTLRASKVQYPNGHSALYQFYNELEMRRNANDEAWANRLNELNQWWSQYPDSKVAPAALVSYWVNYAWKARGSGYSDTVTAQGWKDFKARLAKGHEILYKAKARKDVCPLLYQEGLVVALGESWELEQYDALFNEAVKRFPECNEFYFQKVYYLQPRWHGADREWPDFAAKEADRIGGAAGDKLYARLAWYVLNLQFYDNIFTEFPNLQWTRVEKGLKVLLKEYPNSANVQNIYLKMAIEAGQNALAKQLLAKIGKNIDVDVWQKKAEFFKARDGLLVTKR